MIHRDAILELIYNSIRQSPGADRWPALSPATVLVGENSKLDSLAFVNLVATIEEHLERRVHRAVSVMDLIFSRERLDCTVGDLAELVAENLTDADRVAAAN